MGVKKCIVSFKDTEGFRHAVEVEGESLYEAVALAARSFNDHGCPPGCASQIDIEGKAPAVTHTVTLNRVRDWVNAGAKSPQERVLKERLKELLSALPST